MEISALAPNESKIILKGRLDAVAADRIETRLAAALVPRGQSAIIDLSHVEFVASLGLRTLISVARSMARKNAKLILFSPQEGVREVFDSVSLGDLIPIRDTEADALAELRA